MNKRVSIISVVFNAGEYFEWTLKSIRDQQYNNVEYIVVDGGSTDNTLELIEKYKEIITKWKSEPDDGLYYAMNKGLNMASGEYVIFLNAGDMFYDNNVLKHIFSKLQSGADIYYGETIIIDQKGNDIGMRRLRAPEKLHWKNMIRGMLVCHQSVIIKKSIAPFFNTQYKIAADYLWVLQSLKSAENIVNTGIVVSRFLEGGMNRYHIIRALKERFNIMVREFGFFSTFFQHFLIAGKFFIYYLRYRRF